MRADSGAKPSHDMKVNKGNQIATSRSDGTSYEAEKRHLIHQVKAMSPKVNEMSRNKDIKYSNQVSLIYIYIYIYNKKTYITHLTLTY